MGPEGTPAPPTRLAPPPRGRQGGRLVAAVLDGPLPDSHVEFLAPQPAAGVGVQLCVFCEVWAPDGLHVALEDRVAVTRDDDAGAIGAGIGVARRDALHPPADAFPRDAVGQI